MAKKSVFDLDAEKREQEQQLLKDQINAQVNNEPILKPAATTDPAEDPKPAASAPDKKGSSPKVRRKKIAKERMNIVLSLEAKEKLMSAAEHEGIPASLIIQRLIYENL